MANNGVQNPENLKKQLAVAVRSVQWSYAIFWSLSPTNQGILKWGDGYYNGDIKTRKTFQTMELKADKMGLQRSEQLKELYELLVVSEGKSENELQTKKPSPGLSPEDLSDTEWYYLVCMSFVFGQGQGLPGRALANNQTIWLYDAEYADSKVFSRSLLAKSAAIQTIVCFPYLGGVIELGVTDLVSEDHSLVQHIKASLLEFSKPVCLDKTSSAHIDDDDDVDPIGTIVGHERDTVDNAIPFENMYIETEDMQELPGNNITNDDDFDMTSPDDCSDGSEHFHQTEDSFMLEGLNCGASQAQSWHFMDDDFSNGVQGSINSSDCISQVIINLKKGTNNTSPKLENVNYNRRLNEPQKFNHTKFSSLDLGTNDDDLHYKRIISTVLGTSHQLSGQLLHQGRNLKSDFVGWKKSERSCLHSTRSQQGILKKILLTVPMMCGAWSKKENSEKDWIWNDECIDPVLPDKSKENEKFMVLRSMVPSITKIDKAAILHDTIKYVQELEARVEELESSIDLAEFDTKARNKYSDVNEKTSDNYEGRVKKPWLNKRKASDIEETETEPEELSGVVPSTNDEFQSDMKVIVADQEVLIELKCAWRDYLLLEIIDTINNLQLDAHSVQSSTRDGVLTLAVNSKLRGSAVASARVIKQELLKITCKR